MKQPEQDLENCRENVQETAAKLRESEERYRAFIEQSTEGIWCFQMRQPFSVELPVDAQIRLLYQNGFLAECNDQMARQYGFTAAADLIGKPLDELLETSAALDSSDENYLREFIEAGYKITDIETVRVNKDGKNRYYLNNLIGTIENGELVRAWGTERDVTALKKTEKAFAESKDQLRQAQKIEPLGRLAGGIAHDFNNFLAVIMLQVDMLIMQISEDSPLRHRVHEIKSVTDHAAEMVRQLLAFSRKQTLQPRPIVLNGVVTEFIKILRPLIGEDVEVELALSDDLGVCFVDPNQMMQVLMNLAVNSKDAMADGGRLKIKTANVTVTDDSVGHKSQPRRDYIELTVTDNGSGMDEAVQKHIFEPFFTTKEDNLGTGLGLATVYGIVKQSNGFIWVQSAVNKGTAFIIQFPRIAQPAIIVKAEKAVEIPTGSETILLVEDEEHIRRVAVEVLKALGYQVFEARDGKQAIQLAELYNAPIHLLLTDVIMPQINGRDLAEKIKSLHPETRILFMSGYTDDIISRHGVLEETVNFINKPFTPSVLALKIREILEAKISDTPV